MKIKLSILLCILLLVIAGCSKKEQPVDVEPLTEEDYAELAGDTEPAVDAEPTGDLNPTDDATVQSDEAQKSDSEQTVKVAKTYKEVHPELYSFYQGSNMTFSRWVYTIDKQSNFIGSIIYPDGTTVVGGGDAEIPIDIGKYAGDSSESEEGTEEEGNGKFDVVSEKDKTVNPFGEDVQMSTVDGETIGVTTKTIEGAVIDKSTITAFNMDFSTADTKYKLSIDTVEGIKEKLFSYELYNIEGDVSVDPSSILVTATGTYTTYLIVYDSAKVPYAVTYVPNHVTNTVYMLTASDISKTEKLSEVMQLLIDE